MHPILNLRERSMRISLAICLFLPLLIAFPVQGQDRPGPARAEMESRIESLHRELDGLHSAREQMQRERSERGSDVRTESLRKEIRTLEMEREIARLQMELAETHHRIKTPSIGHQERPEMAEAHRRLEHLAVAREHLREAGLQELAHQVEEQMQHLERRLQSERHQRPAADHHAPNEEDPFRSEVLGAIDELNRAVHQLREEVRSIRSDGNRTRDREE